MQKTTVEAKEASVDEEGSFLLSGDREPRGRRRKIQAKDSDDNSRQEDSLESPGSGIKYIEIISTEREPEAKSSQGPRQPPEAGASRPKQEHMTLIADYLP